MKSNIKTRIYCRVNKNEPYHLIDKQVRLLEKYAAQHNMNVVGIGKDISNGTTLNTFTLNNLTVAIRRKEIKCILIYSSSRFSIHPQLFDKFELFCHIHDVFIISVKNCINDNLMQ